MSRLHPVDRVAQPISLVTPICRPLPAPLGDFVGRHEERARLASTLDSAQLVTVVGPGGVGKTRLALAVADELSTEFAGQVRFAGLAPVADPMLVPPAIGAAVGLADRTGITVESLVEFLARARLLLLADNCEHLAPAVADTLTEVLAACPHVRVLATSRTPLGVPGERVFALEPLAVAHTPPGRVAPEHLVGSDAIELFSARAAEAAPGFALTAHNAPGVLALCRRLDGLPLALELAARRVRGLGIDGLLTQLDSRLDVLHAPHGTGGRHRSLVASLDWSNELLSAPARALWRRLAVFPGGATLAAATAVCAGGIVRCEDVPELLAELVDHSILTREVADGVARYRMLEVIRAYGAEQLAAADERDVVHDRLSEYIRGSAAKAAWWGSDQAQVLARLDAEHANVIAVLEDATTRPQAAARGLVLAGELVRWWTCRGHLSEGRSYVERLLAQVPESCLERYQALGSAVALAGYAGRLDEAEAHLRECLQLAEDFDDLSPYSRAVPHAHAVTLRLAAGDTPGAIKTGELALTLARGEGQFELAICLEARARAAIADADIASAADLLHEALELCDAAGERWLRQRVAQALGECALAEGRLAEGADRFEQCLTSAEELGDWRGLAAAAEGLAEVALARNEAETAARVLGAVGALWLLPGPLPTWWSARHEHSVARARRALPSGRFHALYAIGAELSVADAWRADPHAILRAQARVGATVERPTAERLSRRELEVLRLLRAPLPLREIADELCVSPNTLKSHCRSLYRKLGVSSRQQAVERARDSGLA